MDSKQYFKKSIFRRFLNRPLHLLAMFLPGSTTIRPFLHRLRGVKIEAGVFIGDQVYIENEYPECVEIGQETQISIRSIIIAHFRGSGKVVIGKRVWIGPNCVITTSGDHVLRIGDGAVIGALSVVSSDVPAGTFVSGERARPIARATLPWTTYVDYGDLLRSLIPLRKGKGPHGNG